MARMFGFECNSEELRKYPLSVYSAVAEYRGLACDQHAMDIIDKNPKEEVLSDYLSWHGIRGYTNTIVNIMQA